MASRLTAFASVLLALLLLASPAFAWVELHVTSYEARIELSRQGTAKVDNIVSLRVGGGPLRTFDVKIADRNVTLPAEASLVNARDGAGTAQPVPVALEQRPDGDIRVDVDGKKGVGRGVYELRFAYEIDLLRNEQVALDGSMLKLVWTSPKFDDGIDNMKVTMLVPSAPTEPRVAPVRVGTGDESTFQEAGAFLSSLSRAPQFDELMLVRPYVARNEAVAWAVRIDPKALWELNDPRLRAPAPEVASTQQIPTRHRAIGIAIIAAGALLYGLLLSLKHREVARASRERGAEPRPLVPVGIAIRVAFAGPMLAAGVAWQMIAHDPLPGSLMILGAVLLSAYLPARKPALPRGPGRWLPLTPEHAFASEPTRSAWFDITSRRGGLTFLLASGLLAGGVAVLARLAPYHAHLLAIDSTVLLALWGTGLRRWIPGDMVRSSAPLLEQISKRLRKLPGRIGITGRVPSGASNPDEIRLTVRPRKTLHGFIGLEVGVGWFHGSGGPLAVPEVLVRVVEGSECHDAMTRRVPGARWVRGRDSHERVVVFTPSLPTADGVAALVRKLGDWVVNAPEAKPAIAADRKSGAPAAQARSAASSRSRMSSGRPVSTAKPAIAAVPLQAR